MHMKIAIMPFITIGKAPILGIIVSLSGALCNITAAQNKEVQLRGTRMIIDADTANEIDDFFAIVRALLDPGLEIEGLSSASFRPKEDGKSTVLESQRCNEELLELLGLNEKVPALLGADGSLPNTSTPIDSAAARWIIRQAHASGDNEKLWVVALGQCTNLASALLLDPSITDKVRFAFIDGDFKDNRWGPGIYNWKNDIAAVQVLLASNVEYYHMPARSVSGSLKMSKSSAIAHLKSRGGIHEYLLKQWLDHPLASNRELWTMWDLAMIEAILRPELARTTVVGAPIVRSITEIEQNPHNKRRVTVWTDIEEEEMLVDFWRVLDSHN